MNPLAARLFVGLQYPMPSYLMTAAAHRLARVRLAAVKNRLIRGFVRTFPVNVDECAAPVPEGYETFNDFFTRSLKPDCRPVDPATRAVVSPVDGRLSQAGTIDAGRLLQAKGLDYSLDDLLATDLEDAAHYDGGLFVTAYLAPQDYHRVHAPLAGRLTALRYVPGDLFSVNAATAARVPRLFARNERLVCHFASDAGPFVVVFVGAVNVGSITTPWTGELRPRRRGVVSELDIRRTETNPYVEKGDLLGWFNFGSSVILLLPRAAARLDDGLDAGAKLRMGERIATLTGLST